MMESVLLRAGAEPWWEKRNRPELGQSKTGAAHQGTFECTKFREGEEKEEGGMGRRTARGGVELIDLVFWCGWLWLGVGLTKEG